MTIKKEKNILIYPIPLYVNKHAQVVFTVNIVVVIILYLGKFFDLDCICLFEYVKRRIFLFDWTNNTLLLSNVFFIDLTRNIKRNENMKSFFSLLNVGNRHFLSQKSFVVVIVALILRSSSIIICKASSASSHRAIVCSNSTTRVLLLLLFSSTNGPSQRGEKEKDGNKRVVVLVVLLLFFLLSPLRLFVSGLATLRVRPRLLLQLLLVLLVYRRNKPSTRLARAIDCLHTILY
jgi:hypothetical protein